MSAERGAGARVLLRLAGAFAAGAALAVALYHFGGREQSDGAAQRAEREARAQAEALPARAALEEARTASGPYDVEATMRAVRELDRAVQHAGSVREYLERVARADYRRVAPQVLASRQRILEVLVRYYGALDRQRQEEELWGAFGRWSDELARALQATDVRASTPLGSISLSPSDPERQRVLAEERARREEARAETFAELRRFEEELLYALDAAVPVFREVEDEWARLCAQRDRAYLQISERDFADAAQSARAALAMAPGDTESALLLALALIEGADAAAPEGERAPEVGTLLGTVLQTEPDCAPALLLRGVWRTRRGDLAGGRSDLVLAMTRYPEQAERLRDEFDPYAKREYLKKTRQGGRITGLYRTLMQGANWFSPELQLARAELAQGEEQRAFERVRDHFARRRAQGQWDLVLYDLDFCEDLLGQRYREHFPEKSYLDLVVERRTFRDTVSVEVHNRSDVTLKNAALVLAVRFTDMVIGEYEAFTVGATQPQLRALANTAFGDVELSYSGLGEPKDVDDVVPPIRAVLIADEGVFWIDSIEFKDDLAARAAERAARDPGLSERLRALIAGLGPETVSLQRLENLLSSDDLALELPRELVQLGPLFRLDVGGQSFDEARGQGVEHRLEGGKLRLRFESVGKALDGAPPEVRLVAKSALGEFALVLERGADGKYVFARVEGP